MSTSAAPTPLIVPPRRPALLVSIHDVSPLTLEASRQAVALAQSAGVPIAALTILVIPRHEDRAPLDEHRATREWLRALADAGARLVVHGLTHRMDARAANPWQWCLARGFARGQGEFLRASRAEVERRLDVARGIVRRAGVEEALWGFVPPAWLLSQDAASALAAAGFCAYERFGGLVYRNVVRARRLVGFGSLTLIEGAATAAHARWQSARTPVDTRLAIHPADVTRASTVRAIRRTLRRLRERMRLLNYSDYVLGLD